MLKWVCATTTMDELLNKYLDGKIEQEAFDTELSKLSEDDKKKFDEKLADPEVQKKLTQKGKDELARIAALRKEGKRIEKKPEEGTDYATRLRNENVEKAKKQFFDKFKIPAEEQAHYVELFGNNDSGHVDVDLIFSDFAKIYTVEHSDELLNIRDRMERFESGAEDFNARGAGSHGAGEGGGDGDKKYSQEVKDWVKESKKQGVSVTLEEAEKILTRGMKRTF